MTGYLKLNFEGGLTYLVNCILEREDRQVIVSIHGPANSGKTELKTRANNILRNVHGLKGGVIMRGASNIDCIKRNCKDYILIEDMYHTELVIDYSESSFGKKPDLSIYIQRDIENIPEWLKDDLENKVYDLAIENPEATIK